ncbi:RES family NAD+ phosphorylase [Roseivirga sp. UBA1976]|uniref:RES family NAD+ phosphorylase n=1 Tax=Roseivirga sp. UBA1976 TaxID=1947386 RepID=UPI00257F3566|nr:RES family NAD+ phosphorylase [Roseivirga sp. UBA1976]|tara:strand:+ start:9421 stop:9861 length:441 start_codon:yes stop_codon:yes gene_type:complete
MRVFRICREEYSLELVASGRMNRWNKDGQHVIYAAEYRALCALELLAHTNGVVPAGNYRTMVIEIPETKIEEITDEELPKNWKSVKAYPQLQRIGSQWYEESKQLLLKVPSVLIPSEFNYVINTKHPAFKNVSIASLENFFWDDRL